MVIRFPVIGCLSLFSMHNLLIRI